MVVAGPATSALAKQHKRQTEAVTELEDAVLAFCDRFDFPRPETNVYIAGYLVDALFREQRLIVEVDSYEWHSGRQAFESDRDRDADTLVAGYYTIRITHERMHDRPKQEAARLRAILDALSLESAPDRGSGPPI